MNIDLHLNDKKIASERKRITRYCFRMKMHPECRFLQCDAQLELIEEQHLLHLTAELPLRIGTNEYTTVSSGLAKINRELAMDEHCHKAMSWNEGFILDVLEGVIRYELRAKYPYADAEAAYGELLPFLLDDVAADTIYGYSDSIVGLVSKAITRALEIERKQEMEQNGRDGFLGRLLDFMGITGDAATPQNRRNKTEPAETPDAQTDPENNAPTGSGKKTSVSPFRRLWSIINYDGNDEDEYYEPFECFELIEDSDEDEAEAEDEAPAESCEDEPETADEDEPKALLS